MIVKGEVEIPSDLHGILYEKHDTNGAWKIKLLKELQAVGIYVDIQSAISEF
jgi:predicted nucleotide-binding protein